MKPFTWILGAAVFCWLLGWFALPVSKWCALQAPEKKARLALLSRDDIEAMGEMWNTILRGLAVMLAVIGVFAFFVEVVL